MPLKVSEIADTMKYGEEPQEMYKNVFESVGNHILENADRLAKNIVDVHAGMKIEIDIPINGIVNFSVRFDEYVKTKSSGGK